MLRRWCRVGWHFLWRNPSPTHSTLYRMISIMGRAAQMKGMVGPGCMLVGGGWIWQRQNPSTDDFANVVEVILRSTVNIQILMSGKRVIGEEKVFSTNGTGFVIRSDGLILTNAHVVADVMEGGHMQLIYHDGKSVWADLVAIDLQADLALVAPRIDSHSSKESISKYPPLAMEDLEGVRLGSRICSIGNPLGLRGSVACGTLSGLNRTNEQVQQSDSRILYLQTDLNTLPGCSGGPVFTEKGKVIGMMTERADLPGVSIAIQLESVRDMIRQLEEERKVFRPWLGFKGISLTPELILQVSDEERRRILGQLGHGVLVTKIHENSVASRADLRPGDVILTVDDRPALFFGDILRDIDAERPIVRVKIARIRHSGYNGQLEVHMHEASIKTEEFDIIVNRIH